MTEIKAEVAWQYALPKLLDRFQECVRMAESTRRDDLATSSCHLAYASGVKSEIVKLVSDLSSDPAGRKVRELERKVYVLEAELGGARADAARMREIDSLVSGGRLLDRDRLRYAVSERCRASSLSAYDGAIGLAIETVAAFAAALLSDKAVDAADNACTTDETATPNGWRKGLRAAIRAAGVEPVERAGSVVTVPAAMYDAEKARADKAEAHADEQIADWKKAESTLAALETVIAETSHAAGISGTMTSAARVLEMGRAITQERNMSHDCQKDRNATLAKNRELNERATKAEGALVQMTKEADELRKAYASREAYDASIKATIAAESACKALRAEVVALRGLDRSHTAVCCIVDSVKGQLGQTTYVGAQTGLREALATVPPAKVADAVKPEAAGLEPLGPPTVPGFPPMHYRGLVARINELSAIAKRGGL